MLVCAGCGQTAAFMHLQGGDELCERCARDRSASERGEVHVALCVLDVALHSLSAAGMTADEVRRAVETRLKVDLLDLLGFTAGSTEDAPEWLAGFHRDERLVRLDGTGS